jgi:hypothetical protein
MTIRIDDHLRWMSDAVPHLRSSFPSQLAKGVAPEHRLSSSSHRNGTRPMPLAKIYIVEGRYDKARIAKVSGVVQAALIDTLQVPPEASHGLRNRQRIRQRRGYVPRVRCRRVSRVRWRCLATTHRNAPDVDPVQRPYLRKPIVSLPCWLFQLIEGDDTTL